MASELLFVYGTLRKGAGHAMHAWLRRGARCLGEARLKGRMFLVGAFPAVVDTSEGEVCGELHEVCDPAIWPALDQYEGCAEGLFRRELRRVRIPGGAEPEAWVYIYNRPIDGLEEVLGGDFLAFGNQGA